MTIKELQQVCYESGDYIGYLTHMEYERNFAGNSAQLNKTSEDLGECEASRGIDIQSAAGNQTK